MGNGKSSQHGHHSIWDQNRRGFLRQLCAGALAAGLPMAAQRAEAAEANGGPPALPPITGPVPQVTIAGQKIERMIIGSNPLGGWSHQIRNMTLAMLDYFNTETITSFLRQCERSGLNLFLTPFNDRPLNALKTIWAEGSKMRIYFLGELDRDGKLSKDIMAYKPVWHVHHGGVTDSLFRAGQQEKVHTFVKKVHDELGIPAGVSAHNPDCIKYIEDKGWEVDFYQCCFYYLTRPKQEIRAKLGSAPLGEPFLDTDRNDMSKVIKQVSKPCLAFKILAAGWLCETDDAVEEAFRFAFNGIKKTDAVIIGMYPKFKDEITQNVRLTQRYGALA